MGDYTGDNLRIGVVLLAWGLGVPLLIGAAIYQFSSLDYGLVALLTAIGMSWGFVFFLPNLSSEIEQVGELSASGRVGFGTRRLIETIYAIFRLASQNKVIFYGSSVVIVIGTGLWSGVPGENQTFSFIYATLLFFQVLVANDSHLLVLGEYNTSDGGGDEETSCINLELRNSGTETAHNVQIKYRVFTEKGEAIGPAQFASLDASDRSLEPGDVLEKSRDFLSAE